jgi:hypothetical protein
VEAVVMVAVVCADIGMALICSVTESWPLEIGYPLTVGRDDLDTEDGAFDPQCLEGMGSSGRIFVAMVALTLVEKDSQKCNWVHTEVDAYAAERSPTQIFCFDAIARMQFRCPYLQNPVSYRTVMRPVYT